MNKNEEIRLEIEDMTNEGLGIGHAEGMAVFVKGTLPGDEAIVKIIKVKKTHAYGRLEKVIRESPDRQEAPCPAARICGGCQLQNMKYGAQLKMKQKKVRDCLERIGGFAFDAGPGSAEERRCAPPVLPVLGMEEEREAEACFRIMEGQPVRFRNKMQFPVGVNRDGDLIAGFYTGRTHNIVNHHDCLLGREENAAILEIVLSHMREHHISAYNEAAGTGLVRHVCIRCGFASGEWMVCLVINGSRLPGEQVLADRLWTIPGMKSFVLNRNTKNTNVILGEETRIVRGNGFIEDRIGSVRFAISPRSFYQVNPGQTAKLYETALSFAELNGTETVWDLYCGIGTISLFLAQKAGKVYGVEIIPEAIEDARKNAGLNGIGNVEFLVGKAEEVLPVKYREEGIKADVIVTDPPRKGCERAVLETMMQIGPQKIIYISCDPATLARDLKILCEEKYRIEKIQPVDMFGMSVHVECVVLLSCSEE